MTKVENKFRDIIKGDLRTLIDAVWAKAKITYHNFQKGDNIQGTIHCETVEINLGKLIPDIKKETDLKQIDLFILSAAACLHDIGKVESNDTKVFKSNHGKVSREIILKDYQKLGLDKGQAIAVGDIVSVHDDGNLEELPKTPVAIGSESINIIELAAIFRLADMLDTSYQRAPEIIRDLKFPDENIPSKWRGRQSITGWYLDRNNRIILQAAPEKDNEIEAVYALLAMMREDLSKISPHLKHYGYPSELGELDIRGVFLDSQLKQRATLQRPFPGMAFYTKDDAGIFKGRDVEIKKLLSNISSWPITLLIGESGAGKTSLIHAGLFPKIEIMSWKFVWTRPFGSPKENIKKMIWSVFFEGEVDQRKSLLDIMKQAANKSKPHRLLIVMDQFEDVLNCNVQEILDAFINDLVAIQTGTIIPNLKVLISFREDAQVKLNSRLLKIITGSAQQFPSVELERLTREGAKAALQSGFGNAGIGLDTRIEEGQKQLIEIILDDIQKADDRLYPPYVQMVAETLCKKINTNNPIITKDIYLDQLKGADNIIARYLIERINEFGPQKANAEKILIFLTSSAGKKAQKSLMELRSETDIEIDALKEILNKMIDLRMARPIGDEKFEIIHDCLSKIVDEELVKDEDRTIKFLNEQLNSFSQSYKVHGTPIMSFPFMANLYRSRRKIKISEEKYPLILCTCLYKEIALGWFWLKDVDREKMFEMIKVHLLHEIKDISDKAFEIFIRIVKPEDRQKIIELLHSENKVYRKAAIRALGNILNPDDKNTMIEMLNDKDKEIRWEAVETFVKFVNPEDRDKINDMLGDKNNVYSRVAAIKALGKIIKPDDRNKIIKMFSDENRTVRENALEVFVNIIKPEDRNMILKILQDEDEDNHIRVDAVDAFRKIAKREDRDVILSILQDEEDFIAKATTRIFADIVKDEDKAVILDMLNSVNKYVRIAAIKALRKIAKAEDIKTVKILVYDKDESIKQSAIYAYTDVTKRLLGINGIINLLYDTDSDIQQYASEILPTIAKPEDKDKIIKMLSDRKNHCAREVAVMALGNIAKHEDMDTICSILSSDVSMAVRQAAVTTLVKIAKLEDSEFLLDYLAKEAQGWSEKQKIFFRALSLLDDKYYRQY